MVVVVVVVAAVGRDGTGGALVRSKQLHFLLLNPLPHLFNAGVVYPAREQHETGPEGRGAAGGVLEVRGELPSHHRLSPALSSHQHTKRRGGVHNFQPTSCARGIRRRRFYV